MITCWADVLRHYRRVNLAGVQKHFGDRLEFGVIDALDNQVIGAGEPFPKRVRGVHYRSWPTIPNVHLYFPFEKEKLP